MLRLLSRKYIDPLYTKSVFLKFRTAPEVKSVYPTRVGGVGVSVLLCPMK